MSEEQVGFRVTGVVQGVGFRWWTRRMALHLGLRGAVRNQPDGSVEVHVRGTPAAVRSLEDALHRGPSGARVRAVKRISSGLPIPDDSFALEG